MIYQLLHTLNYGDAISTEAVTISRLLDEGLNKNGGIYSLHAHQKMRSMFNHYSKLEAEIESIKSSSPSKPIVILHYSIGSPLNQLFVNLKGVKKVIIYHNLTPDHFFKNYNYRVYSDLVQGREELVDLFKSADKIIADSTYNANELRQIGFENITVLPIPLDRTKWEIEANAGIEGILKNNIEFETSSVKIQPTEKPVHLLHVGRIAPNKKIEDIIKTFYFYYHKINPNSRLWLIGHDIDTEIYSLELRRYVSDLMLGGAVSFVGSVADSELKSFYQNCSAYICTSEHEGFCVPLIEAMYFSLPIIAYDSTAIGETLGEAGILLNDKKPELVAEVVDALINDKALQDKLKEKSTEQLNKFSEERFVQNLKEIFLELGC